MKTTKRIRALLLCALFLFSVLALCACGKGENKTPEDNGNAGDNGSNAVYKVTVVDGSGQPYTEKIIVKFMQNGTQVAMVNIDSNGVAQKELPKGEYTLEIATTESGVNFWFDQESAVLTAEKTEIEVTLTYAASGEPTSITATVPGTETSKEYQAYNVGAGSTYVLLTEGDRTYVVFTPTEGGIYEFTVDGDAQLGYYGAPHFVQPGNMAELVDNSFTLSVSNSGISFESATGTTRFVIGLDAAEGVEGVMLNIVRIGDPEWSIEDEPWVPYQNKWEIADYTLPADVTLKGFELTAPTVAYNLVLNETDRCYHLNSADGKLVFVQLEKECYGISLKTMVGEIIYEDGVLMQSGTAPFRYMYNNGKEDFFKEDYTDAMRQFVTKRDAASGVYPLTEDLYYMLQKGIEFMGWCDPASSNYRFADVPGVNNEISWLFLCEYVDGGNVVLPLPEESGLGGIVVNPGNPSNPGTPIDPSNPGSTGNGTVPSNPIHDNKNEPIEVGGTLQFDAQVQPGHLVYYALFRVTDTTLTINNSNAYVIYKGKTYTPVNGVVTVPDLYSANTNVPVKLSIGNMGSSTQNYHVTMSYPQGHQMNPFRLTLGTVSTYSEKDNNQGVCYTYQPTKAGTLTIRLDNVSGGHEGFISITSSKTEGGTRSVNLEENANADGRSVSFQVSAGESVIVMIGVKPTTGYDYPEATITTTVSFA